ncbi:MAG: hypothetical protein BWY09_00694 [Candidatus Hydrogenedentes bacterium ADurb.Bin179]|nr:MAG: hypothetical protein BWY09_00694 [Candidatus Hydrogenedentes bacterium ADurb.Bin179]
MFKSFWARLPWISDAVTEMLFTAFFVRGRSRANAPPPSGRLCVKLPPGPEIFTVTSAREETAAITHIVHRMRDHIT